MRRTCTIFFPSSLFQPDGTNYAPYFYPLDFVGKKVFQLLDRILRSKLTLYSKNASTCHGFVHLRVNLGSDLDDCSIFVQFRTAFAAVNWKMEIRNDLSENWFNISFTWRRHVFSWCVAHKVGLNEDRKFRVSYFYSASISKISSSASSQDTIKLTKYLLSLIEHLFTFVLFLRTTLTENLTQMDIIFSNHKIEFQP